MASQRNTISLDRLFSFVLLCEQVLASPVPEIFPPEVDSSFTELALKAFFRILEQGFVRGVAVSLLILGCVVCLLAGTLRALARYLERHDTKLWDSYEDVNTFDDDERDEIAEPISRQSSIVAERRTCNLRAQTQSRVSRYILSNPSTLITKINIHASPRRAAATASDSASPSKIRSESLARSPSTSLRSALSKSPSSSKRFSSAQVFLFGARRASSSMSSTPSPKSVRWADQIHVSVTSTVEMRVQSRGGEQAGANAEAEIDIATRPTGNRNSHHLDA